MGKTWIGYLYPWWLSNLEPLGPVGEILVLEQPHTCKFYPHYFSPQISRHKWPQGLWTGCFFLLECWRVFCWSGTACSLFHFKSLFRLLQERCLLILLFEIAIFPLNNVYHPWRMLLGWGKCRNQRPICTNLAKFLMEPIFKCKVQWDLRIFIL